MDDIGSHQHPVDLERVAAARAARLSDADAAGLAGPRRRVGEPVRAWRLRSAPCAADASRPAEPGP